jgi:hypothetical protein
VSSETIVAQPLLRSRLMQSYLENAGPHSIALERTALRGESVQMRELLAHAASHGTLTYGEIRDRIVQGLIPASSLHAPALGRLAHVVALQDVEPDDTAVAIKALELALSELGPRPEGKRCAKLLAELYFEQQRYHDLESLARRRRSVRAHFHSYITVDSASPFVRGDLGPAAEQRWLRRFNWQFTSRDLKPVTLRDGEDVPFNRLTSEPDAEPATAGPMVTVIMTSFKPRRGDVLQAARSILEQTWTSLELLIVDDASPIAYSPVLDELDQLDPRLRVIRLQTNGGTYVARNVGLAQARGEFVTGQDSDDWSHPQRLEVQVNDLLENPQRPGNQVYTVNMTEDLVRIRRGYGPFIPSAPTLMVRTPILRELGGYIPLRKAADNELRDRITAYSDSPIFAIPEPLIFMRILPDSLSRSDFRPGWQHPARRAFWSSYRTWHATVEAHQLHRSADQPTPVYVPPRFTSAPQTSLEPVKLDVVFAADWCEDGEIQASAVEELRQLLDAGYRVGALHMENAIHLARYARTYTQPLQQMISAGQVAHVIADETHYQVNLMLVRSPELLQFMPHRGVGFNIRRVAVVAEKPPWEQQGLVVRYLPSDCSAHAAQFFGARPRWVPKTAAIRATLKTVVAPEELNDADYATPFNPRDWQAPRRSPAQPTPVIGRWAGETAWQWPASTEQIHQVWPTDGSADVRFYGSPATVLTLIGHAEIPPEWLWFRVGEIDRRTYYRSLDFYVHYRQQRSAAEVELPVLEALATGCVAVLPPWMERAYGQGAVYADPLQVHTTLRHYMENTESFMRQSDRGVEFARAHLSSGYRELIDDIMAGDYATAKEEPPR